MKLEVVSLPEIGLTGFELVRVTRAGLVDVSDIIMVPSITDMAGLPALLVTLPTFRPGL